MSYTSHCEECPLKGKADVNCGRGPEDARFLVVVDSPSAKPETYNRLMPQSSLGMFSKHAQAEQFRKDDFFFYPQIRCAFNPDDYTTKEKTLIQKSCRPHLVEQIRRQRPEVIIPLGGEPSKQVHGRAVKITKIRGMPVPHDDFKKTVVLPMLNPLQVVLYPQHEPTFKSDFATLGRLVDNDYDISATGTVSTGDYEFIDDLEFLIREKPSILAFDTENTGLRWYAPDAATLTMQFCIEPGRAYLLPWDHPDQPQTGRAKARLKRQLRQLLQNPKTTVIGQNTKYDAVYTMAQTGIRFRIGGDTLMLATMLDENATTKNLADLVKRFVPEMGGYSDFFDSSVDKSKMRDVPLDDNFLQYGAGDADAVFRLHDVLYDELSQDKKLLARYNHVVLPGLNAFASIELRGQHVSPEEADEFEAFMEQKVAEQRESLLRQVPKSIKRAHVEKGVKFSRAEFLRDILFHHKDGFKLKPKVFTKTTAKLDADRRVPSTSTKDHLPYFYDQCPFTFELAEHIKADRILNTNVKGFRKKYIVDDMVRPVYGMHVAVTGRTNSEDPNGQNVPKRGPTAMAYRKMFVAPEGYFLIENDLSQAELRIAADMANDPTMLNIYRNKGDIHTATALIVMGVTMEKFLTLPKQEQKDARTKAKAVNFGFLYGMSWRKFIAYAKTQYGAEFTEREAQRVRIAFFDKYSNLLPWHAKMREYAHTHKFVRSYSGAIRHLPMIDSSDDGIKAEAERQAINSPVQNFGSDLGVMALGRMEQEIDPQYLQIVGFVHDAIYAYVPKKYVEWGAKTLRWYMETNPLEEWFGRKMRCPIVADAGFGTSLGSIHEMGSFDIPDDGLVTVGDYDFDALFAEEKEPLYVPRQRIPPNNGRLLERPY